MNIKRGKRPRSFSIDKIVLLCFFFLSIQACTTHKYIRAQGRTIVDLKQFGFVADGKTNNSVAFKKLSQWLTGKKNLKIVFPPGQYIVGKQTREKGVYLRGQSMLTLYQCNNIIVDGNNASFKYVNGLKFGSFNPKTGKKYVVKNKSFTNRNFAADIGNFIHIRNSSNISIKNFNANGNMDHINLGGPWGDQGIQLNHTGVRIVYSDNISVSNCTFSHFGLDGMYILNKTPNGKNTASQKINIDHVKSLYSARQGLSWTGGSGLTITQSEFSFSAQGKVRSMPGSGIDIEPHANNTCTNGLIQDCKFINNRITGLVSDFKGRRHIYNINIDRSYFQADKGSAIFPRSGGITISNSKIVGPCIGLMGTEGNESKIINCYFTDSLLKGQKYLPYLFNPDKGQYYTLENCTFSVYRFLPAYISSKAKDTKARPNLKSNTFILRYKKKPIKPWVSVFRMAVLENNTFIDKTAANMNEPMYINTKTSKERENIYRGTNKIISKKQFGWRSSKGPKIIRSKK